MDPQVKRIFDKIEAQGWQGRMIPIGHLAGLREAIQGRYENGLLDPTFYQDQLDLFSFDPPPELPGAQSIFIVAVPTPQMRVFFHWKGKRVPVVIPPTYVSYTARTNGVQDILGEWMREEGYHFAKPELPLKTLAVRSGLACYGRNNITYVSGMGSFLQLVSAFSDVPCNSDPWREPRALERCGSCSACFKGCPTGAITNDRFLIHAENCLTYFNEAVTDFPGWIDPSWHHCLFGCMRCQIACPENKDVKSWFEDRAEFSEEETSLLYTGISFSQLPESTAIKINGLQINEKFQLFCRNLSMILAQIE